MRVQARGAGALVLSFAVSLSPTSAGVADPLRIVIFDLVGLPAAVARPAFHEMRSALGQAGLGIEIRAGRPGEELAADEVVVVIVPQPAPVASGGRNVLGAVRRHRDASPWAAWIHLPTVLKALELPAALGAAPPSAHEATGRALGRVAAHEVVHLVVPDRPHAPSGLMAASLGRAALTSAMTRVDRSTREAVCARRDLRPAEVAGP